MNPSTGENAENKEPTPADSNTDAVFAERAEALGVANMDFDPDRPEEVDRVLTQIQEGAGADIEPTASIESADRLASEQTSEKGELSLEEQEEAYGQALDSAADINAVCTAIDRRADEDGRYILGTNGTNVSARAMKEYLQDGQRWPENRQFVYDKRVQAAGDRIHGAAEESSRYDAALERATNLEEIATAFEQEADGNERMTSDIGVNMHVETTADYIRRAGEDPGVIDSIYDTRIKTAVKKMLGME
jgi:hypothetical protein